MRAAAFTKVPTTVDVRSVRKRNPQTSIFGRALKGLNLRKSPETTESQNKVLSALADNALKEDAQAREATERWLVDFYDLSEEEILQVTEVANS